MNLPNEQQLFYSKDGTTWSASLDGQQFSNVDDYLYKHLTWDEYQDIQKSGIDVSEYQETKKESLRANCKDAIESLITSSALGSEHTYDCREIDQHNLQMIISEGNGGEVYTHDGTEFTNTTHTHAQCQSLLGDMNTHIKTCRDVLDTKRSLVNAATTADEVNVITWDG